ncbi:MAG TPA: hypothetical protein VMR02_14295 [Terracidiphilus sp.]|jgi:hypothetical protein|nr:hypothetical protein [Terracidiphilus sp.]
MSLHRKQMELLSATFAMRFGWNYHQQLKEELDQLRNEQSQDRSGWGALGRAAEFLVSQRGLRA